MDALQLHTKLDRQWYFLKLITVHKPLLINPQLACTGRVTVPGVYMCACVSLCLSVDYYSRTTGYSLKYGRYQKPHCYKCLKKGRDIPEMATLDLKKLLVLLTRLHGKISIAHATTTGRRI